MRSIIIASGLLALSSAVPQGIIPPTKVPQQPTLTNEGTKLVPQSCIEFDCCEGLEFCANGDREMISVDKRGDVPDDTWFYGMSEDEYFGEPNDFVKREVPDDWQDPSVCEIFGECDSLKMHDTDLDKRQEEEDYSITEGNAAGNTVQHPPSGTGKMVKRAEDETWVPWNWPPWWPAPPVSTGFEIFTTGPEIFTPPEKDWPEIPQPTETTYPWIPEIGFPYPSSLAASPYPSSSAVSPYPSTMTTRPKPSSSATYSSSPSAAASSTATSVNPGTTASATASAPGSVGTVPPKQLINLIAPLRKKVERIEAQLRQAKGQLRALDPNNPMAQDTDPIKPPSNFTQSEPSSSASPSASSAPRLFARQFPNGPPPSFSTPSGATISSLESTIVSLKAEFDAARAQLRVYRAIQKYQDEHPYQTQEELDEFYGGGDTMTPDRPKEPTDEESGYQGNTVVNGTDTAVRRRQGPQCMLGRTECQ